MDDFFFSEDDCVDQWTDIFFNGKAVATCVRLPGNRGESGSFFSPVNR